MGSGKVFSGLISFLNNRKLSILLLSLLGFLYASVLSYYAWMGVCLFPCGTFFDIPTCYFGWVGFLVLLVLSVGHYVGRLSLSIVNMWSLVGMIMALFFAIWEFGISSITCVVGFLIFFAVYYLSSGHRFKR